jgi:hypothetical protein
VVPDFLHIVPVGDDTMLDRILERKNTTLGLGLITYVRVLLTHTNHYALMAWTTDDRGEDSAWSVITGETGLTHTGTIVDHKLYNAGKQSTALVWLGLLFQFICNMMICILHIAIDYLRHC